MNRMARHTRQPEVLRELFEALGNDPFVIAECFARPLLAERLISTRNDCNQTFEVDVLTQRMNNTSNEITVPSDSYVMPVISNMDPDVSETLGHPLMAHLMVGKVPRLCGLALK